MSKNQFRIYASEFHGGHLIGRARKLETALKFAARKYCGECRCQGPKIVDTQAEESYQANHMGKGMLVHSFKINSKFELQGAAF